MKSCANSYVPYHDVVETFFKFWWNEELDILKETSVTSDRLWKAVDRRRSGTIFNDRQQCKRRYKRCYLL